MAATPRGDDDLVLNISDDRLLVAGMIDAYSVQRLRRRLFDWLDAPHRPERPLLDLTGVSLFTAAGVTLLIETVDRHPELVVRTSDEVERILRMCDVRLTDIDRGQRAPLAVASAS